MVKAVKPELRLPPRLRNYEGRARHVGVELEFAAMSAKTVAEEVQALFGGRIAEEDRHRYRIEGTSLGDFETELDTRYAHRSPGAPPPSETGFDALLDRFGTAAREVFGDISSLVMPREVVCPPIPIQDLPKLEQLVDVLHALGAQGTRASPFYAFGAQLNPDIATRDGDWILAVLKSYLLLSDWLRAVMAIDLTRRVTAFADPFPPQYVTKVLSASYWPALDRVIDDYLADNPTRNRELDLLPLFAWFDEETVRRAAGDAKVKKRPTFHYRLPDANIGSPGWSLTLEWNRWCVVERLAEDRERLNRMGEAYRANASQFIPKNWAIQASEWLIV